MPALAIPLNAVHQAHIAKLWTATATVILAVMTIRTVAVILSVQQVSTFSMHFTFSDEYYDGSYLQAARKIFGTTPPNYVITSILPSLALAISLTKQTLHWESVYVRTYNMRHNAWFKGHFSRKGGAAQAAPAATLPTAMIYVLKDPTTCTELGFTDRCCVDELNMAICEIETNDMSCSCQLSCFQDNN